MEQDYKPEKYGGIICVIYTSHERNVKSNVGSNDDYETKDEARNDKLNDDHEARIDRSNGQPAARVGR